MSKDILKDDVMFSIKRMMMNVSVTAVLAMERDEKVLGENRRL